MISELIGGVIDLYKQRLKKQQNITRREIKKEELRIEKEEKEKEKAKKEGRPVKPEKGLLGGRVRIDLNGVQIDSKKEQLRKETARRSPKKRSFVQKKMDARKCEAVKKSKRKELLLRTQIIVLTVIKYVVKIIEMFIKFLISVLGVLGFAIVLFVLVLMIVIYGILKIEYVAPSGDVLVTDDEDCIPGQYVLDESGISGTSLGSLSGTLTVYQQNLYKTFALVEEFLKGDGTNVPLMENLSFDAANRVFRGIPAVESGFYIFGPSDTTHDVLKDMTDSSENDAYIGPHQISSSASIDYGEYYKFWGGQTFVNSWKQKYPKPNSSVKDHFWMPYSVAMSIMHVLNMGSYGRLDPSVNGYDDFETFINASMDHFGIQANREECFQYIRALMSVACYLQGQGMAFINYNTGSGGGAARINYLCAVFAASSDDDSKRSFNNYSIILNNETLYKYAEGIGTLREWLIGSQGYNSTISDIGSLEIGSGKNPRIKVENTELTVPLMRYIYEKYKDDPYMTDTWSHIKSVSGQYLSSYHYGLACLLQGNHIVAELGISAPITSGGYTDDCECVETDSVFNLGNRDFSNITVGEPQGIYPASIREEVKKMTKYQPYFGRLDSLSDSDGTLSGNMSREEWRLWTKWKVPYQYQVGGDNWQDGIYRSSYEKSNACPLYLQAYMYSALTGTAMNVQELQAAQAVYYNGGVAGAEHDGGYYPHFQEFCEMAKDAGFYVRVTKYVNGSHSDVNVTDGAKSEAPIIYPDASLSIKEQIDYVLDNNGIVGVVVSSSSPFASSQHYFCITEHVSENEYKTHSATNQSLDVKTHKLEEIIGTNGAWLYTGHAQNIVFAWNPNLEVSRTLVGNGDGIAELSNILFVGDSYTVGLNNSKNLESENEIFAAVSASPSQFVGSTSQSVTIGAGDGNEKTGQIPDGNYNAVIVLLGVNNLSQTEDMKTFLEELDSKFDCPIYVQKVFPVGSGYTNGSTTAIEMNENIKTYNDTIKSFCDSNNAFTFIDTTLGLVDADGFLSQTSDNLHLNGSSAFDIWYNNIKSSVLNGAGVSTGNQYDVDCIDENVAIGEFVETPGQFQGPWGDLTDYVNQMSSEKSTYQNLIQYVGLKPVNESESNYLYNVDAYKTKNGKGFVRYNQGYGNKRETWSGVSFGDSTFASAGCGVYSTAGVLSTMLGKYINPVEVAIAISTYEIRHPGSNLALSHMNGDNSGAFTYTDLAKVIEECGLSVETASSLSMTKVDDCLNNSGMVILVVNSSFNNRYTSGGHYVVIREKTSTGYLIYSSTNWVQGSNDDYCNTENTASELQTLNSSGQIVYVTP